jgi:septal ring factor EnvC (AmiA/AmiB activator)
MTQEEEIARLKKQLSELVERFSEMVEHLSKAQERESQLLAHVSAMQAENQALHEQLAVAPKRIEELEKQKTPPPAFVKVSAGQASSRGEEAAQEASCPVQSRPTSRSADPGS